MLTEKSLHYGHNWFATKGLKEYYYGYRNENVCVNEIKS